MSNRQLDKSQHRLLRPTLLFTRREHKTPELTISGGHVLVALTAGVCLVGTIVWGFVKYWLFRP